MKQMKPKTHFVLFAGPDRDAPLRIRMIAIDANEDGVRAGASLDVSLEEAEAMVKDIQQAIAWIRSGVWAISGVV